MKKMLVVIDYQKDFVDGALGFPGAEKMDEAIAAKIRKYYDNDDLIIQTMDSHEDNYMETREGKHLPVKHCIYGTPGWETYGKTGEIIDEIEYSIQFRRMGKATFPMHPYAMVDMLDWIVMNGINLNEIEEIEFVGLVSNICVISNICVFQGAFPNAQIIINPELTASHDPAAHEAVLTVMKGLQVKFIDD